VVHSAKDGLEEVVQALLPIPPSTLNKPVAPPPSSAPPAPPHISDPPEVTGVFPGLKPEQAMHLQWLQDKYHTTYTSFRKGDSTTYVVGAPNLTFKEDVECSTLLISSMLRSRMGQPHR